MKRAKRYSLEVIKKALDEMGLMFDSWQEIRLHEALEEVIFESRKENEWLNNSNK